MNLRSHRPIFWRRLLVVAGFGIASMIIASCSKAQAKTTGPGPVPLSVPEPPGRLQIPVEAEPPLPTPATEKPAVPDAPATRPRPTPTPTPTAPPPPTTPETTPPPVVQTAGQVEHEANAKEKLASAEGNLARVKRESLGREAQGQYDIAKNFIRKAKDALTVKNYPYAASCADKAATLAALLVKGKEPAHQS